MTKNNNKSNNTLMRFGKALAFMLCTTAISSSFATLSINCSITEENMQEGMSSVYEPLELATTNLKSALKEYISDNMLKSYLEEYQDSLLGWSKELEKLNAELIEPSNEKRLFENELKALKKLNAELRESAEYQKVYKEMLDKKEKVAEKIKCLTQPKQKWISQLEDSTKILSLLLRTQKHRLVDEVNDIAKDRLKKLNDLNDLNKLLDEPKNPLDPKDLETLKEKIKNAEDSLRKANEKINDTLTNKVYSVIDTLFSCYARTTEIGTDSTDCAVLANIGEIEFIASTIEHDIAARNGSETLDDTLNMLKLDRELVQLLLQKETIQNISTYYEGIFNSYVYTSENQFHSFRKMVEAIVKIDRVAGRFIADQSNVNNIKQRIFREVRGFSPCDFKIEAEIFSPRELKIEAEGLSLCKLKTPEDILDLFGIVNTIQENAQIFPAPNAQVYYIANVWPTILEKALGTIKKLNNAKNRGIVLLQILKETKNLRCDVINPIFYDEKENSKFYNEVVTSILNFIDNTLKDENSPEILYVFDLWLELAHEINNKKDFPFNEVQRILKQRELVIDRCINFISSNHDSYTTYDEIKKIYTVLEKLNSFEYAMLDNNSFEKKCHVKLLYKKVVLRYIKKIKDSYVGKEIPELQKIIESLKKMNTSRNLDQSTDQELMKEINELRREIEDYCLNFYKNVTYSQTNDDDKTAMYNLFTTLLDTPYSDGIARLIRIHMNIGEIVK